MWKCRRRCATDGALDMGAVPARQRAARRDTNSSQNTALTLRRRLDLRQDVGPRADGASASHISTATSSARVPASHPPPRCTMRPIGLAVALALSLSLAPLAAEAQTGQQAANVRKR